MSSSQIFATRVSDQPSRAQPRGRTGPRRGPETSVGADVVLAGAVAHCVRDDGRPDAVSGESVQVCLLSHLLEVTHTKPAVPGELQLDVGQVGCRCSGLEFTVCASRGV